MDNGFQSASIDIYEDESICKEYKQCQYFKSIQSIIKPVNETENYTKYSQKFRNYLLKYLYEDENLIECLKNIRYLTVEFYEDYSSIFNTIFEVLVGFADVVMIICYCLAFTKKHRYKFKLLKPFYWFLYMLGQIIILSYGFSDMGKLTERKCRIKPILFSIGFTLSHTVLLIRILINFPESDRRFVRFFEKNFGKTIIMAIIIDIILNSFLLINPYKPELIINDDLIYHKCKLSTLTGKLAIALIFTYKMLILLIIALLIFIEWNIREFKYDVHYATSNLFISFIIFFIFGMVQNIEFKGYVERFFIPSFITYIYGISCFSVYFVARFFSKYNYDNTKDIIHKKSILGTGPSAKALNSPDSYENCSYSCSTINNTTYAIHEPKKNMLLIV